MRDYLAELAGPEYVDAILWTLGALILLALVLGIVKAVRTVNSGTFVAGGRTRKTRLAVMDATAIDSQRRLVLVRRDDVEHLLLIGGPTDVVVEQDIRLSSSQRRPQPAEAARQPNREEGAPSRAEAPPSRPAPSQPGSAPPFESPPAPRESRLYQPEQRRAPPPQTPSPQAPLPQLPVQERPRAQPAAPVPRPAPAPLPPRAGPAAPAARVEPRPAPRLERPPQRDSMDADIDDALMKELDLTADDITAPFQPPEKKGGRTPSLDDEMARLLGELSNTRR